MEFTDEWNGKNPDKDMYMTSYWHFVWMTTQRLMRDDAVMSVSISIPLAGLILILTSGELWEGATGL